MADAAHRLYSDLAHWWPLFSPPIYYIEEAADLMPLLDDGARVPGRTLLARADWLQWCDEAGLDVRIHHDEWNRDVFVGRRRG